MSIVRMIVTTVPAGMGNQADRNWKEKCAQVRRRADAQNSHPVAIGKTCLYLPNADNHKAGATNRPKINGLILSQTIKNNRRAQYAFHKDYKTARFEPL